MNKCMENNLRCLTGKKKQNNGINKTIYDQDPSKLPKGTTFPGKILPNSVFHCISCLLKPFYLSHFSWASDGELFG